MISPPPYPRTPNPQFPNTPSTFHLSRFTFFVFQSGISNLKSAIFYTYSPIHRLTKFLSSLVTQPVLRSSLLRRVDRVHCDFSIATCLLPDAFRLLPFFLLLHSELYNSELALSLLPFPFASRLFRVTGIRSAIRSREMLLTIAVLYGV